MEQGPPQEAGEQDGRADEYQRRERKNETGGTSNSFAALADGSGSMANVTGSTVHTDLTVGEFSSWA
ncbi:hypothetical protein OUZ56_028700 [Daphnia magna]|uniref:Uncharacterized protein n=1 Tax=Daphnia magna TaxID=35525 RepID=A0ABR0B4N1_9CRUS|nr:hypothetical protein OUZ56_028700 [Daphnia magna]